MGIINKEKKKIFLEQKQYFQKKWLILILVVRLRSKEGVDVQKEQLNQANHMYQKKKYPVEAVEDPREQLLKPPKSQRLLPKMEALEKDEVVHPRKGEQKKRVMALQQLKSKKAKAESEDEEDVEEAEASEENGAEGASGSDGQ